MRGGMNGKMNEVVSEGRMGGWVQDLEQAGCKYPAGALNRYTATDPDTDSVFSPRLVFPVMMLSGLAGSIRDDSKSLTQTHTGESLLQSSHSSNNTMDTPFVISV
jgi:hypothetical protein